MIRVWGPPPFSRHRGVAGMCGTRDYLFLCSDISVSVCNSQANYKNRLLEATPLLDSSSISHPGIHLQNRDIRPDWTQSNTRSREIRASRGPLIQSPHGFRFTSVWDYNGDYGSCNKEFGSNVIQCFLILIDALI